MCITGRTEQRDLYLLLLFLATTLNILWGVSLEILIKNVQTLNDVNKAAHEDLFLLIKSTVSRTDEVNKPGRLEPQLDYYLSTHHRGNAMKMI